MPRTFLWSLYSLLVVIWSSTWVAIKIGLEDLPPLFSAGVRFSLAGVGLLLFAAATSRPLKSDPKLVTVLALGPFATTYGLIYWGEQYVPSGLAAVLFGVMPLYSALLASVALTGEPLRPRLLAGIAIALTGLSVAFSETLQLGDSRWALLAAMACAAAPLASAIGNVSIKRRGGGLDAVVLNGWAMLAAGLFLSLVSAAAEAPHVAWSAEAIGSIGYLALIGSAVPFVTLTILLRELPAVTVSYITLLLPFGALVFGAVVYDETITLPAVAGAALVATGLLVAQTRVSVPRRRAMARRTP
jgi:drug/metabolite transporter (DMT)-like permease